MSQLIVQKYGGTSVGSVERIEAVADRVIENRKKYKNVVVVVSAMGKTTDDLVSKAKKINPNPSPREYDALISTGENISASLLAMAIHAKGEKAISLNGLQAGIQTEPQHSRAKITKVDTKRILTELENEHIVIVTGFQGYTQDFDVTTIGRGGSDTSAVVLAAALNSKECEIYTDVDGIYTTDPRKVESAKKLQEISYDEMLELASLGAQVLHPRAVECAKENDIILHVRSSFDPHEGTRVKEAQAMEINKPVTGVTVNQEEASISILQVPDTPGIAGELFTRIGKANINVDMIIQSVEEKNNTNTITYTVHQDSLQEALAITRAFNEELNAGGVQFDDNIAKISIVGVGMISKPGIAAKMFSVLGEKKINIMRITTSEIKISCAIPREDAQKALELLHDTFELDK